MATHDIALSPLIMSEEGREDSFAYAPIVTSHQGVLNKVQSTISIDSQSRLRLCLTVPHGVAVACLFTLCALTVFVFHRENGQQLKPEDIIRRSAFVYLVGPGSNKTHINDLGYSLKKLNQFFNSRRRYRIIVAHDDIAPVVQGRLQAVSVTPVEFRKLELPGSPSLNMTLQEVVSQRETIRKRDPLGHQKLIRFWAYTAALADTTKTSVFADVDYIVRLDTDSAFMAPVTRDFVYDFVKSKAQYAYKSTGQDCCGNRTATLKKLARSYVKMNGIRPRSIDHWARVIHPRSNDCLPMFESDLEVLNLRFFRSHSGIQSWIHSVDANGGIFNHLWTDSTLRYLTVALYAAPEKIVKLDAIPYVHPHMRGHSSRL